MLTDTKLRNLKPRDKLYKVNDREGLYVAVTPAGSISFRYNYSINGRQETITFGRYGVGGITLAEARELLGDAKKMVAAGKSPAKEKARDKARVKDAETFGAWAEKWLRGYQMADSTRDMRRSVYERELKPKFSNQKLVGSPTKTCGRWLMPLLSEAHRPPPFMCVKSCCRYFAGPSSVGRRSKTRQNWCAQQASLDSSHVTER